jgi:hypothetical protein
VRAALASVGIAAIFAMLARMSETRDEPQSILDEPVGEEPVVQEAVPTDQPADEQPVSAEPAPAEPDAAEPAPAEPARTPRPKRGGGIAARRAANAGAPAEPDGPTATDDAVAPVPAPAAAADDDRGASEWTLRILVAGMMFLLLLCAIFIIIAA